MSRIGNTDAMCAKFTWFDGTYSHQPAGATCTIAGVHGRIETFMHFLLPLSLLPAWPGPSMWDTTLIVLLKATLHTRFIDVS